MAHVQINIPKGYIGSTLVVDGVDITHAVLASDIRIAVGDGPGRPSKVHLTLLADVLDLDIEDAALDARMVEEPRKLCDPAPPSSFTDGVDR